MVGFEVKAKGVRAGTHSESWREKVPGCSVMDNAVGCYAYG